MAKSIISSQLQRAGDLLQFGASNQIKAYSQRYQTVQEIYKKLLHKLFCQEFSTEEAINFARAFFGGDRISFAAVDGTEYTRPLFDLVIFFGGAYAAMGEINFNHEKPFVKYSPKVTTEGIGVSSCVPMYINEVVDIDQTFMRYSKGEALTVDLSFTDEEVVNNSSLANSLMTFSELYLALQLVEDKPVNIMLLDRSLSTMHGSLVYDTRRRRELWQACAIFGYKMDNTTIDENDLSLNRHRLVNSGLMLPPPRGDYLCYAITYLLETKGPLELNDLLIHLKIQSNARRQRVQRVLVQLLKKGIIFVNEGVYTIAPRYHDSWTRIKRLVKEVGRRLFTGRPQNNPLQIEKEGRQYWLTTLDLAFLSLFCLYMVIETCWNKQILLVGITKDTTARDFKNHLIPLAVKEEIWQQHTSLQELQEAPNTDRMLLQYLSIYNYQTLSTPWSIIEYDSSFRTIISDDEQKKKGYVQGAIRNRITPERCFLKTYIQLAEATIEPQLRSNVLLIDRLVYPQYDLNDNTVVQFNQLYGGAIEPITPILYPTNTTENKIQNFIMITLKTLANTSIPDVFGHNMPLFIADQVAKWHNAEMRKIIDSTGVWLTTNRDLRQFVFFMSTFRERRNELEAIRRAA